MRSSGAHAPRPGRPQPSGPRARKVSAPKNPICACVEPRHPPAHRARHHALQLPAHDSATRTTGPTPSLSPTPLPWLSRNPVARFYRWAGTESRRMTHLTCITPTAAIEAAVIGQSACASDPSASLRRPSRQGFEGGRHSSVSVCRTRGERLSRCRPCMVCRDYVVRAAARCVQALAGQPGEHAAKDRQPHGFFHSVHEAPWSVRAITSK